MVTETLNSSPSGFFFPNQGDHHTAKARSCLSASRKSRVSEPHWSPEAKDAAATVSKWQTRGRWWCWRTEKAENYSLKTSCLKANRAAHTDTDWVLISWTVKLLNTLSSPTRRDFHFGKNLCSCNFSAPTWAHRLSLKMADMRAPPPHINRWDVKLKVHIK